MMERVTRFLFCLLADLAASYAARLIITVLVP
jgi:hypothetical protein